MSRRPNWPGSSEPKPPVRPFMKPRTSDGGIVVSSCSVRPQLLGGVVSVARRQRARGGLHPCYLRAEVAQRGHDVGQWDDTVEAGGMVPEVGMQEVARHRVVRDAALHEAKSLLLHINDDEGGVDLAETEGPASIDGELPLRLRIQRRRCDAVFMRGEMRRAGEVEEAGGVLDPERRGVAVLGGPCDLWARLDGGVGVLEVGRGGHGQRGGRDGKRPAY